MTVVVRMDVEHLGALNRALEALRAEGALMRRWGHTSTANALAIDALYELVVRYHEQTAQHPDPWSRKVTT